MNGFILSTLVFRLIKTESKIVCLSLHSDKQRCYFHPYGESFLRLCGATGTSDKQRLAFSTLLSLLIPTSGNYSL